MKSGEPGSHAVIDNLESTCYQVTYPKQAEMTLEHLTLSFDHQGKTHIEMTALGLASEITQCDKMNIFYSMSSTSSLCEFRDLCMVEENNPAVHYANVDLVTCKFNCTCASLTNQCEIYAYTFYEESNSAWQLCELVIA